MFTPISAASISPGCAPLPSTATRSSVAGRLLTRFASAAAIAATTNRFSRLGVAGSNAATIGPSPCWFTPATTTPRASTNKQNSGDAADTSPQAPISRRATARAASTAAPPTAIHTGSTPTSPDSPNPARVTASTPNANTGTVAPAPGSTTQTEEIRRSAWKNRRNTKYSTPTATNQGGPISAANRANDRPEPANASRLVRLDTGNSNDAEFARCVHAYTCGRARTRSRLVVANTTGGQQDHRGVQAQHR